MDGHTHSAFGRLEVVETGRRRRWSEDEKARIVLESLAGPRLVSATARRHGISRSQLLAWHRTLRAERSRPAGSRSRGQANNLTVWAVERPREGHDDTRE